jgi:hypothetical protein
MRVTIENNIDVEDIYYSCSLEEKKALVGMLKDDGVWEDSTLNNLNFMEEEWNEILDKLSKARLKLTIEEEEIIKKIANKY